MKTHKPGELDVPTQVRHQIFLSYAALDQDLVENFADRLLQNGVRAWVYSIDKTFSAATWSEIDSIELTRRRIPGSNGKSGRGGKP